MNLEVVLSVRAYPVKFWGGGDLKQSESIFGLSAFCRVPKLFPDVRAHCIVVLAFKNGHANRRLKPAGKVLIKQE